MADVFVSYKAEDRSRVAPLVQALEQDGFSVWWDAHIGGGDRWRETILKNLESAPCVIVVWSKRSTGPDGEFVRDEATRAKRRNAYLPVRIDKVDPPLGFGETQALSLHGWKGDPADDRYRAVVDAVRHRVGHDARPAHHERPKGVSRRTAIVGATGVAALAAVGTGAWWSSKGRAAGTSIAVLPFANLSGDPAQAYFSDGMAEELRSALSRIAGLKVMARTSSEAVRNEDIKSAANKLDVAHILTGSVRRSSSLVRISAQLVDGHDGTEQWSEDYDRPTGDTLQIQSDIASRVASALALQLVPASGGRLTLGGTANADAHDLFLKGLATRQSQHRAETLSRAVALFDDAIRLDPHYADAFALKATTLVELGSGFSTSGEQMKQLGNEAAANANRALALAPNLPAAHAALAAVAEARIDFALALEEFRKAAASSTNAVILGDYGRFLGQLGLADEAHKIGRQVISLDPLNGRSYVPDAQAFYAARQYPQAINAIRRLLLFSPGTPPAMAQLADSLLCGGDLGKAASVYRQIAPDDVFRITGEGILAQRLGNYQAAKQAAEKIKRMFGSASSYQLAELQAQRGEQDLAFAALADAVALPDPGMISLLNDPFLDPLRPDPRFAAIKRKIHYPPELS